MLSGQARLAGYALDSLHGDVDEERAAAAIAFRTHADGTLVHLHDVTRNYINS